ncbi:hypothetical protein [Gulosibacter bifidus]|uniref:Uncharacterized protein n=1 Tax=Gulosibacter bifidus TaxID=272239 RepID=A0ABW5RIK1_9MICO|nr:hypothetical protein [Gulosibacter bifidus]
MRSTIPDLQAFRRISHEEALYGFLQIYDVGSACSEVIDGWWLTVIPGFDEPEGINPAYCEVIGAQITPITAAGMDAR